MADEVQGETPEVEKPAEGAQVAPEAEEFDKERALATIKKLREFEKEAKAASKKLEAYEKAEAERKQAEMSELDKWKLQAEEANAKASKLERESLQRRAAEAAGLPSAFAGRLTGDTLEAMTEDAKGLLEHMPKATAPKLSTGNPAGGSQGETDASRLARLGMR